MHMQYNGTAKIKIKNLCLTILKVINNNLYKMSYKQAFFFFRLFTQNLILLKNINVKNKIKAKNNHVKIQTHNRSFYKYQNLPFLAPMRYG